MRRQANENSQQNSKATYFRTNSLYIQYGKTRPHRSKPRGGHSPYVHVHNISVLTAYKNAQNVPQSVLARSCLPAASVVACRPPRLASCRPVCPRTSDVGRAAAGCACRPRCQSGRRPCTSRRACKQTPTSDVSPTNDSQSSWTESHIIIRS